MTTPTVETWLEESREVWRELEAYDSKSVALVHVPYAGGCEDLYRARPEHEVYAFAYAFIEGWRSALDHHLPHVEWWRLREHGWMPRYAELRDYLVFDCGVAPVQAARVALYLCRWEARRDA